MPLFLKSLVANLTLYWKRSDKHIQKNTDIVSMRLHFISFLQKKKKKKNVSIWFKLIAFALVYFRNTINKISCVTHILARYFGDISTEMEPVANLINCIFIFTFCLKYLIEFEKY